MANYRRRNGAAQKKDVLNKRSTIFWSKMSVNRMESRKKDCSGGPIGTISTVQGTDEVSKENKVPSLNKTFHQRRPSLKELCPEDKHRVKLLIEQLARTSSEKEAMEDLVKEERRQFAVLLEKLKTQHHKVVKEKKELESELHASQLQLQAVHTYPPSLSSHQTFSESTTIPLKSAYLPTCVPSSTAASTTTMPVTSATIHSSQGSPTYSCPPTHSAHPPNAISNNNDITSVDPLATCNPYLLRGVPHNVETSTHISQPAQGQHLPELYQPLNVTASLHQLPQTNLKYQRQCDSMSSGALSSTSTKLPCVHASYPTYFTIPTSTNITAVTGGNRVMKREVAYPSSFTESLLMDHGKDEALRNVVTGNFQESGVSNSQVLEGNSAYPPTTKDSAPAQQWSKTYPPSVTDSLCTTAIEHCAPFSSTHIQNSQLLPKKKFQHRDGSTTPIFDGSSHMTSSVLDQLNHGCHMTCTENESAALKHEVNPLVDKTNKLTSTLSVSTPPKRTDTQPWLSLPSATPEEHSFHGERTDILFQNKQNEESCREIGTQTPNVESVATQTDIEDKRKPVVPLIKESVNVSSSSPSLTKSNIATSMAMKVGDQLVTVSSDAAPSEVLITSKPGQEDGASDGAASRHQHGDHELSQGSSDETLLIEELRTSLLLNGRSELSGRSGISQTSADLGTSSRKTETSLLEPLSSFELAASLNSHNHQVFLQTSPSRSYTHPHLQHTSDSTASNTEERSHSSSPDYLRNHFYSRSGCTEDGETESEKLCLDESDLIEELFFI